MKQKAWGAILLSSALLLTGCTSNKETKQETKEKVEQTNHKEDNPEDLKVYQSVHSQYEEKINKEVNEAILSYTCLQTITMMTSLKKKRNQRNNFVFKQSYFYFIKNVLMKNKKNYKVALLDES